MKSICMFLAVLIVFAGVAGAQAGAVSVVAGTGIAGFSGDGGPAAKAQFNFPVGLAVDAGSNIYVADDSNYRVRRIDTNGIISTIAGNTIIANGPGPVSGNGGLATQAEIGVPVAVALDAAGNLYISDSWNKVIRRVDSKGIISTFGGEWPKVTDAAGNTYIPDTSKHQIRKVDKNGVSAVIAGVGISSHEVGDFRGNDGPATQAYLQSPSDVVLDAPGNIYFLDQSNGGLVVRINSNGIIHIVAGPKETGLGGDFAAQNQFVTIPTGVFLSGLAIDKNGLLYFSDGSGHKVYQLKPWSGTTQPPPIVTQPPPVVTQPPPTQTPPPIGTTPPPPTGTQPPPSNLLLDFTVRTNPYENGLVADFTLVLPPGIPFRSSGFKWNFGDGDSTKEVHPEHIYRQPGSYTVSVEAVTESGQRLTQTKKDFIVVDVPPTEIKISPASINFGEVGLGQISRPFNVVVTNTGKASLVVNRIVVAGSDSGQFMTDKKNFTVKVGDSSQTITVKFVPVSYGIKSVALMIYGNIMSSPTQIPMIGIGARVKLTADFNGDGRVNFDDLFLFVDVFGKKTNSSNSKFDLDGDGEIGFGDFFIFANAFGK